jgi:hypothetical protein
MAKKVKLISALSKEEQMEILNMINDADLKLINISSKHGKKGVEMVSNNEELLIVMDILSSNEKQEALDDEVMDLLEDSEFAEED